MSEVIEIKAQPGPQEMFFSTSADIAIFGGAAGGGKSWALLVEPLRHYNNPKFGGVIFRRNATQVRAEGGLWDASHEIYSKLEGRPKEMTLEWSFPTNFRMRFAHLEHEKSVLDWQGSEIPFMGFDELTHFTAKQFWYMLSRNRSTSGVSGYIRATCNADCESWVRELIDWWIDPETGLPINERAGVIRWFIREGDSLTWASTREELIRRFGHNQKPKSFTFIPAKLTDNKILMEKDPSYLSNLMALDRVSRAQLLEGNWNVKISAGAYFKKEWFPVIYVLPPITSRSIRYWDRAATVPSEGNKNPDWTVGVLLKKLPNKTWVVCDVRRMRESPAKVEQFIRNIAEMDGVGTEVWLEQDPGSAGVSDVTNLTKVLAGFRVKISKPSKDKVTRAKPVSSQCEAGNVSILRGAWNNTFLQELENFPPEKASQSHDDQVDAFSGAFNAMLTGANLFDVL
jgi:predicted phage terminase large subunit-like protein